LLEADETFIGWSRRPTPHSSSSTEATADRRWSAVAANLDPWMRVLTQRSQKDRTGGDRINRLVDQ
jgi:hypothetical protein